jgi:hypothetical protein
MREAEQEILRMEMFEDNELSAQEREENRAHNQTFLDTYASAKPAFDRLAAQHADMPKSVGELVSMLQLGGAFWALARNLYEGAATKPATDSDIRRFYDECEAFRTIMIALYAVQFDRCVKPADSPSLKMGRNDTFMAICLPYTDEFVTNDDGQLACFKEIVQVAGIDVKIRSYLEFRNQFSVLIGSTPLAQSAAS